MTITSHTASNLGTRLQYHGAAITSNTISFTDAEYPAATAEGDLLLLIVRHGERYVTVNGPTVLTAPAGWTLVATEQSIYAVDGTNSDQLTVSVFKKTAVDPPNASFDVEFTGTNPTYGDYTARIYSYEGANLTVAEAPSGPFTQESTGQSTNPTATITTQQPGMAIHLAANQAGASIPTNNVSQGFTFPTNGYSENGGGGSAGTGMSYGYKNTPEQTVLFPTRNMFDANCWVTLSFIIIEPPFLSSVPPALVLDDAPVGDTSIGTIRITNEGAADATFAAPYAQIDSGWTQVPVLDAVEARIPPGQYRDVTIGRTAVPLGLNETDYTLPYFGGELVVPVDVTGVEPTLVSTSTEPVTITQGAEPASWNCTLTEPDPVPSVGDPWTLAIVVGTSSPTDSVSVQVCIEWPTGLGEAQIRMQPVAIGGTTGAWTAWSAAPDGTDPAPVNPYTYYLCRYTGAWTGNEAYNVELTGTAVSPTYGSFNVMIQNTGGGA